MADLLKSAAPKEEDAVVKTPTTTTTTTTTETYTNTNAKDEEEKLRKKKLKNQWKQRMKIFKYCIYAFIGLGLGISYYLPRWMKILLALSTVFTLAIIYLPKRVKYRWELKFMVAQGFELKQWLSYVKRHHFALDPIYWHRALFISILASFTSLSWSPKEEQKYPEKEVQSIEISEDPIFVLGHFRSGTSLLHELLNNDTKLLAPTVYQCFAPRTFLTKEEEVMKFASDTKFKRPMDSMKIKLSSPQEDEFALTNLHGLSPYLGSLFPRDEHTAVKELRETEKKGKEGNANKTTTQLKSYMRYLTFRNVSEEERTIWKDSLVWFYKKVLYKNQDKRLLLKSPTHTARVQIIKEVFPNAKFIHISRNPYEIFSSTRDKLFRELIIQWNLQYYDYDDEYTNDLILNMFGEMYDAHFQDRETFGYEGEGNLDFVDVKYEELMANPTATIEKIYGQLQLEGWEEVKPKIEEHQSKQKTFVVNAHVNLEEDVKERVYQRMKHYFDKFGYAK